MEQQEGIENERKKIESGSSLAAQREDIAARVTDIMPEMLGDIHKALEAREIRVENLAADVLKDPERALKVLHSLEGTIRHYEELQQISERRKDAVLSSRGGYALQVAPLLTPAERDEDDQGGRTIDEFTDPLLREGIWNARDAARKRRNLEALSGYGPGKGQEYLASLKQHSRTLREHLQRQMESGVRQLLDQCATEEKAVSKATAGKEGARRAYLLRMIEDLQEVQKDVKKADAKEHSFPQTTEVSLGLLKDAKEELERFNRGEFDALDIDRMLNERQAWLKSSKALVAKLLQRENLAAADKEFLESAEKRLQSISPNLPIIAEQERKRIDIVLASLTQAPPNLLQRAFAEDAAIMNPGEEPVTLAWCDDTKQKMNDESTQLLEILGSDEDRTPRVTALTKEKVRSLENRLSTLSDILQKKEIGGKEAVRRERVFIEKELLKIEECRRELQKIREAGVKQIDNLEEYKNACDDAGGTSIACYQPRDRRMYANGTRLQQMTGEERERKLREIAEHEFNHAIKDIIRATVFPNLLIDELTLLFPDKGEREQVEELLLIAEKEWNITKRWEQSGRTPTRQERLNMVLDELGEEYRAWQSGKKIPRTETEKRLHAIYAQKEGELPYHKLALHMTADDADGDGTVVATAPSGGGEMSEKPDPVKMLKDLNKKIADIEEFGREFPTYHSEVSEILDSEHGFRAKSRRFDEVIQDPGGVTPEEIAEQIEGASKIADDILESIQDIRLKHIDPTYAQPEVAPGFWDSITFLSLSDIAKICKDLKEDWLAESTRAQERRTSETQEYLTSMIPDDLPFPWGKYTSRLKHYARRRKTSAEQEGSKKWEDALQLRDPHKLLAMLGKHPTRDQLKAIITLLCHKGHMDWNDPNFIRAIENESGYKIPAEAMKRDVDRDKWLRKILTAIWPDEKEFYDHSRVENDSSYESAKGKYKTLVDDISNMKGESARQLQDMLTIWVNEKKHPPIDISPHKYEEIIHFSMRNGKMTMEQKFYYLVRGAAEGILPAQRVRALAGETAGLLSKFPFIDYFSGNDNTLPLLQSRAARLIETDAGGNDTFKPGAKTTMWLHRTVARDPAVRTRVLKGASRIAEEMDHEDIPFFITALGVNVGIFASVISGHRQKVTPLGWKNAYCGYSSDFKIFGYMAKLEKDHKPGAKIGRDDLRQLAQNLAGYIFMDNALTRSVCDLPGPTGRPVLEEAEFNGLPAPSAAHGKNTKQYQTRLNDLVRDVIRKPAIRRAIEQDAAWQAKCSELNLNASNSLDKYAPLNDRDPWGRNTTQESENLSKLKNAFDTALERAIMGNTEDFKDALIKNADSLLNEGGSPDLDSNFVEANLLIEAAQNGSASVQ